MSQTRVDMEKFPDLVAQQQKTRSSSHKQTSASKPRTRRKSASLISDIRGDTSVPAVSTLSPSSKFQSSSLSPRNASTTSRGTKHRKAPSLFRQWIRMSFTHTWVNPLVVILIVLSLYALNPTESNPIHNAMFLSYALPKGSPLIPANARHANAPVHYGKGPKDLAFVAFYIVVISFLREFLMQRLIRPLALSAGIRSRSKQARFMEQAYTAIYFAVLGPFGLYVMSRSPVWYFNTTAMYETFPNRSHEAIFKAYYLVQASYWAQQAIVLCLMLEKPRKDFKEFVAHHVITLTLIGLSYRFHFTYMGLAVYITHDISDFFLATSKLLNYIDSPITTAYFTFFAFVWLYLRHYINLQILWSIPTTFQTVGPFDLDWAAEQYKCWISQYLTFGLLASLQSINLFWFFLIIRIAYKIAFEKVVEDVRSDDESEVEAQAAWKRSQESIANGNGVAKDEAAVSKASGVELEMGANVPDLQVNGHAVESSAAVKEGESFAGALKENRRKGRKSKSKS